MNNIRCPGYGLLETRHQFSGTAIMGVTVATATHLAGRSSPRHWRQRPTATAGAVPYIAMPSPGTVRTDTVAHRRERATKLSEAWARSAFGHDQQPADNQSAPGWKCKQAAATA